MIVIAADWKEIIAARIRDRDEQSHMFDIMLNTVEREIDSLLNDLTADYGIKTSLKCPHEGLKRTWTVKIDNEQLVITTEMFTTYYREHRDTKMAITEIFLDNFKFDFKL